MRSTIYNLKKLARGGARYGASVADVPGQLRQPCTAAFRVSYVGLRCMRARQTNFYRAFRAGDWHGVEERFAGAVGNFDDVEGFNDGLGFRTVCPRTGAH